MPRAIYDSDAACFETVLPVEIAGANGSTRCEWEVLDKPTGSQVIIPDDLAAQNDIQVSQDGAYSFRVCCFYTEGVEPPPSITDAQIFCPFQIVAGEVAQITLIGCEDASIQWSGSGGGFTSIVGDSNGASVTTDVDQSGIVVIQAVCTQFGADGNPQVTTLSCLFNVLDSTLDLACSTGPSTTVEYVNCGERCECTEFTIVFDCGNSPCSTDSIALVFKDCPPCEEAEDCPEIEELTFLGVEAASIAPCSDFIECCDEVICCDPHLPVLMWNNLCTCPGWTFQADAIEGSDFYNACSCNPGQKWCFEGPVTITGSGPAQFVDVAVVWGHSITNGSIQTSPLQVFGGGPTGVGVINDGACIEGYTQPVILNFDQVNDSITNFSMTIESEGLTCIDQIFIGRKLFLPDDRLPLNFVNPHDGDDYSLEVKESDCGILSRSIKHEPCDWSLEICANDEWLCDVWRPFIRYARRHGFMFQWSRNRKPNDIINAWLVEKQQGSTANEFGESIVTLNARGYISQPQTRYFV